MLVWKGRHGFLSVDISARTTGASAVSLRCCRDFFFSGLAVDALWHGPERDISGEKRYKSAVGLYQ